MKVFIKACAIIIAVTTPMLLPVTSFSGTSLKLSPMLSIYTDDKGIALKQPEGVACGSGDIFVVADTGNGRLLRYLFSNHAIKAGPVEFKLPQLPYPIKVQMNAQNEIYVLDGKLRRIVHLNSDGGFIEYLDPKKLPAPAMYVPKSFSIDMNNDIYILDIFSRRVLVLDPAGEYRRKIEFPEAYGFFSDLTVDFKGNIFLIDSVNAMVFSADKDSVKFSPITANLKQYMRFPTRIITDRQGRIYLVDRNGGSIIILGQDGSFLERLLGTGWKEGFLNHPSQLCINGQGEVFVADTSNSRIQIFTTIE